jgi:hypothetical protein
MFRRHPQADRLTPDAAWRLLSRYYGRYDAAYRDNAPRSLLAHYQEVLASDFVYVDRQRKRSDGAAFLAEYERAAKIGRFTGFVAVFSQKTTPGSVGIGADGDTVLIRVTEQRVTFEYDMDGPVTGPDGLSGNPQPQAVTTTLRWCDTWTRNGGRWQMRSRESLGGRIDASYLDAADANAIIKRLPQNEG